MESRIVAHIVCSSLSLICVCVQTAFLIRSAVLLGQADRRQSTGIDQLRAPHYMLQAKQALPVITAMSGLAYCGGNLVLQIEGRTDAVGLFSQEPLVGLRGT